MKIVKKKDNILTKHLIKNIKDYSTEDINYLMFSINKSKEGVVFDTIKAFGSGLKSSIFGPSKKEKEASAKEKELSAKKEEMYNRFKDEINFHSIFNIKHPENKITKIGTFKCTSGKVLMGDCDHFYEKGVAEIAKGTYNFEVSRLTSRGGKYIDAVIFRLSSNNKSKIVKFLETKAWSIIDGGVCSLAEGTDEALLTRKNNLSSENDDFYEEFDQFIQMELNDMGTFKHSKLHNPVYSVSSGGDGSFYSVVGLDANNKPVEYYFVFGYIEDYIDTFKEKEINEAKQKLGIK